MDDESNKKDIAPVLEMPPQAESPVTRVGNLLSDDSLSLITAKFTIVESLLKLTTRDCSFNEFLREVLLSVMRVVKCEAGSILEVDHRSQMIFFRSIVGTSSDRLGKFVIPMGKGIVGYVAESRQPVNITNLAENKQHLKSIQEAVGFSARNMVAVPIIVRGKVFGIVELLNRVGEENFTNGDVELLTYICEMSAKAIEARLMIAWANRDRSEAA